MPYDKNQDLPKSVKDNLPSHAQDIYREAFNHAYEEYKNSEKKRDPEEPLEEVSHRVAWSAVKKKYVKNPDGSWALK